MPHALTFIAPNILTNKLTNELSNRLEMQSSHAHLHQPSHGFFLFCRMHQCSHCHRYDGCIWCRTMCISRARSSLCMAGRFTQVRMLFNWPWIWVPISAFCPACQLQAWCLNARPWDWPNTEVRQIRTLALLYKRLTARKAQCFPHFPTLSTGIGFHFCLPFRFTLFINTKCVFIKHSRYSHKQ